MAGAGLAGTLCAYELSKTRSVLLLDPRGVSGGTSGGASGLVSPMMSKKANVLWNWEAAMEAFELLIQETGSQDNYDDRGVLRPAGNDEQVAYFRKNASLHSPLSIFLEADEASSSFPQVRMPLGGILVHQGGSVDIENWLIRVANMSRSKGLSFSKISIDSFIEGASEITCVLSDGQSVKTNKLLLCRGRWFGEMEGAMAEDFHQVKGQALRISRPKSWSDSIALSASINLVTRKDHLLLGSTFEHQFENLEPSKNARIDLMDKAKSLCPILKESEFIDEWVGVRVTRIGSRLPIASPVGKRAFVVNALGSKGILLGSLIASNIESWLDGKSKIPRELLPR